MRKLIISVLILTGCTTILNKKTEPCPKFYTYICEERGSHKDCWCEETRHLELQLKQIQQRAFIRETI